MKLLAMILVAFDPRLNPAAKLFWQTLSQTLKSLGCLTISLAKLALKAVEQLGKSVCLCTRKVEYSRSKKSRYRLRANGSRKRYRSYRYAS